VAISRYDYFSFFSFATDLHRFKRIQKIRKWKPETGNRGQIGNFEVSSDTYIFASLAKVPFRFELGPFKGDSTFRNSGTLNDSFFLLNDNGMTWHWRMII